MEGGGKDSSSRGPENELRAHLSLDVLDDGEQGEIQDLHWN